MMNGWARYYFMDADQHIENDARHQPRRSARTRGPRSRVEEVLRERFVRGTITRDELEDTRRELH